MDRKQLMLNALRSMRSAQSRDYQDPYQQIREPSQFESMGADLLDLSGKVDPAIGGAAGGVIGGLLGMAGGPLAPLTVPGAAALGTAAGAALGSVSGGIKGFAANQMRAPYEEAAMRAQLKQQQMQAENQRRAQKRQDMLAMLSMMRGG